VKYDLILVGFGNVARRFVDLLHERRRQLARDFGVDTRVVAIITRHGSAVAPRTGSAASVELDARRLARVVAAGRRLESGAPPSDPLGVLDRALRARRGAAKQGRLIVVETTTLDIKRGEPAITHVEKSLAAGAHVVTANKGPAAFAWDRLSRRAARANRRFLFEGAVMDGVPVFNLARDTLPAVSIEGFRGVVNTTTNFILSAMEAGREFDAALSEMQAAGIAEADASLDIDGWDAAAKTSALANVLLGARMTPADVDRHGIGGITPARVAEVRRSGRRLKLVAEARRDGKRVAAGVKPVELPEHDLLAQLGPEENSLLLRTDLLGEIAIVQRSSSLTQTAYALLSDVLTIARGR
jgi:homoserine dehydrogenase